MNTLLNNKTKYWIIAFWLCVIPPIMAYILDPNPCIRCLTERALFTTTAIICLIAKWMKESMQKYMKRTAIILVSLLIASVIYHLLIIFEIVPCPKFCKLDATFTEKLINECQKANPLAVIGTGLLCAIILAVLAMI